MSNALQKLTKTLAAKLDMGDGSELIDTLKATAFRNQQVSDAQMTALLVVANQYGLNPWTKEIYAFPDKQNGIVPVVGVDGWSRIINDHPQFDGMEFRQSDNMIEMTGARTPAPEWMECVIYRKDRSHPTTVREYLDEVYRAPFKKDNGYQVDGPWQTHTKRFLRHKAMIQSSRLAFGYGGIYDQDEAERIVESSEKDMGQAQQTARTSPELPNYSQEDFEKNLPVWRDAIQAGKATADQIIARVSTKGALSEEQKKAVRAPIKQESEAAESRVEDAEFKAAHEGAEQ